MVRCNSCVKWSKYIIRFNNIEQHFCPKCFIECKTIVEAAGVPFTVEEILEEPPLTRKEQIEKILQDNYRERRNKPLSTEERDRQEQLRIIRGIKKHFNKPPS